MRRRLILSIILALLGCKAETFGGEDPVIDPGTLTVVGGTRLAGSLDTISAPWMAEMADTMSVRVDDAPASLAVRVPGRPAEFILALPESLAAGTHELTLQSAGGDRTPIGTISTGGFSGVRSVPGAIFGPTQALPALPGIAGMAPSSTPYCGGVPTIIDARDATIRRLEGVCTTPNYGVGGSYLPGRFLIPYRWSGGRVLGIGIGSERVITDSVPLWGNTDYPAHELAPGLYLKDEKYYAILSGNDSSDTQELSYWGSFTYRYPQAIAYSPDGVWAVPGHDISNVGLLIVDRVARTHHWAPGWAYATRAVFANDGRLVVYGWRAGSSANGSQYAEYLAHVDPASGALLDSVRFADAGSPYDHPAALSETSWLVIPAFVTDHLELSIRDPNSLVEIAHPRSPQFPSTCYYGVTYTVVEDPPLHRFYLVGNDCYGSVPIATFQLPE